jgi:hypothetical protein
MINHSITSQPWRDVPVFVQSVFAQSVFVQSVFVQLRGPARW